MLSECSAHYVHFGYNIRLCVWSLYTSTLYWTVSEEACPHHESVWVCMRVSPLFRRGEKCYCSLAIAVFIYNDWAFAIQNVSLYIEYENIYDYICMKHENGLGLLLWQTALEMIWIWFGGVNLILLCTMSASAEECVCVCVWLVCLFLSRRPAACPQTLTHAVFSSNAGKKWNLCQQVGNFIPSQHDGESRSLQRLVSSLSSAYTCDWRGLPLFPVASTLTTLYFCNIYSLTYFF